MRGREGGGKGYTYRVPPFALVCVGFGVVCQRWVPGQFSDAVLPPQGIVLVEHRILEDIVVKEVVVVVVFDFRDGWVVGNAEKSGVERVRDGWEDEGQ